MNVLAVVAHPDDEVLGVGGTLARHAAEGHEVTLVVMCENMSLHQRGYAGRDTAEALKESALLLGVKNLMHYKNPDQRLDSEPFMGLVRLVQHGLWAARPRRVYTHWQGDLNRDHRIVAEAVHVACRPKSGNKIDLYEFPTPSSTEYTSPLNFVPDTWVDIGTHIEAKKQALAFYETEMQQPLLPRNLAGVKTVARYHGMQVGLEYAEVFRTARRIF